VIIDILRHGIAEPRRPGLAEADRELTSEGRDKLRPALKRARRAGVKPSLILTSPLKRAVQTAEIAAKILRYEGELTITKTLAPQASPEKTWQEIRRYADRPEILLAGHEPHTSKLVAYLLGVPQLTVDLKKGGLVRIRMDEITDKPKGILEWILAPKLTG
jgi:phosphohistidine phosphatase